MQEGKEVMTVARLNSRIQSMTALEGAPSGPDSPASQSTALPCLNPSPAVSVQVLVPVLRRSQSEGATLPQSLLDWHMSPQSWQDGMSIAPRVYCPAVRVIQLGMLNAAQGRRLLRTPKARLADLPDERSLQVSAFQRGTGLSTCGVIRRGR